jgi:hypothetical protein
LPPRPANPSARVTESILIRIPINRPFESGMSSGFLWRAAAGEIEQATQAQAQTKKTGYTHAQLETELAMVKSELQAVKRENVELRLKAVHVQALTEHAEVIFFHRLSGAHSHAIPSHSSTIP